MTAIRAVLIAMIILGLAVAPLAVPALGLGSSNESTAFAAFAGGTRTGDRTIAPMQNGNSNDNGGDNNGNNNNNNDNDDGNGNGNDNNNNNDNNGGGNDNVVVVVRQPNDTINKPTKCFDTGEVSVIQLGTGSYDVTVSVMPHSSFGQTTRMTLRSLDPASVASTASAGSLIDSVVFQLDAQSSCDGVAIGKLPNLVNLGIIYNVTNAVDKSKLQIVKLDGSTWTKIATSPDPVAGNPYVSATIADAGTYALVQTP